MSIILLIKVTSNIYCETALDCHSCIRLFLFEPPAGLQLAGELSRWRRVAPTGRVTGPLVPSLVVHGPATSLQRLTPSRPCFSFMLYTYCQVIEGSLEDGSALDSLMDGVDGLFHLAGSVVHSRQGPATEAMVQALVSGTQAVMRCAASRKVKRVVYASTSGVVAPSRDPSYVASK